MKPARGKKAPPKEPKSEASPEAVGPGLAQTGHASRTQSPAGAADAGPASGRVPAEAEEVPRDAYVVSLPVFEGPLDMLLEIIQKHELDIMDIPMGFVTEKYLEYLAIMQSLTIDVASEYLVMAATLTLIKSRMLLPDDGKTQGATEEEEEELDPRAELVRRLLEYQRYKAAGETLNQRDTLGNSVFPRGTVEENVDPGPAPFAPFGVIDLLSAFKKILDRSKVKMDHEVVFDRIGITERIVELTEVLKQRRSLAFEDIFSTEGRAPNRFDLVITFLAVLEMCRMKMMRVFQVDALSSIHVELLVVEEDEDAEGFLDAGGPTPTAAGAAAAPAPVVADEPAMAEPEVEAAEPEVEPAEPEVEAVDAVEPEVEAAEPEVEPAEPEVEAVDAVEPEVEAAEPEGEPAEPEVEAVDAVEPEVEAAEPEVEAAEPEVDAVEPEGEAAEPEGEPAEPEVEALDAAPAEAEPRAEVVDATPLEEQDDAAPLEEQDAPLEEEDAAQDRPLAEVDAAEGARDPSGPDEGPTEEQEEQA